MERAMSMYNSSTQPQCRVCLQQCSEQYSSLFDFIEDTPIHEHITSLVDIKISENDGYPQVICRCCLQDLQVAISFRQRCLNTNSSLSELELLKPVKKEEIKSDEYDDDNDDHEPSYEDEAIYKDDQGTLTELQISIDKSQLHPFIHIAQINSVKSYKVNPEPAFQCHDCGETFRTKCKLRVHWKKIHLPFAYKCLICKRIFKSPRAYHKHLKNNEKKVCVNLQEVMVEGEGNERKFVCRKCNHSTKSRLYMETHSKVHGLKMFACDMCPQMFRQKSALSTHKKYTHKLCTDKFTCHICGKQMVGKPFLIKHLRRRHSNKVQCDICKKEYKNRDYLVEHMKRHNDKKTHNCTICTKSYYTTSALLQHQQIVHEKKQYQCKICGYKSTNSVKKHELRHTDGNVACVTCGKFFENNSKLQKHAEVHNSEKKFFCPICNHNFLRKKSVGHHIAQKHRIKNDPMT
ncbi:zinc finger and BTB domain-containing protein 41 [Plutella xylostella]|uniref:zinc finger and BTB domain-containing protein 41 n=1 Tax=Plutella xylostella TaxID=51655 RepID=UPI0020322772|nr:zinc finger and BTB domain-containing protein 41 [Plutella xylostella]